MKKGERALKETSEILGIQSEDTGGGNICFCFTTPDGENVCFGWANGPLGWSFEDGHDGGDMDHKGTAQEQAAYIREICGNLGIALPILRAEGSK
jgi:hypothetical protein